MTVKKSRAFEDAQITTVENDPVHAVIVAHLALRGTALNAMLVVNRKKLSLKNLKMDLR